MGNLLCGENESEQKKPESWKDRGVSLQRNLVREQHRDFREVYHVVGIIGEGSISNIYKIKKRKSVIGRSSFNNKKRGPTGLRTLRRQISRRDKKTTVSGQFYALKEIDTACVKEGFMEELFNEVAVLRQLDHPHIVKLYETYFHRRTLSVVLELCTGGDLYKRNPYTAVQAAIITKQVLLALNYMHAHHVVHRDIKFENIMYESDDPESLSVKVIDFGLARVYHKRYMSGQVGTLYTMSPEIFGGIYTSKTDLWSLGVVTFMLLSGTKPFWGKSRNKVINQIRKADYNFDDKVWNDRSQEGKDFISSLLELDPDKRLDAHRALKHPWLSKEIQLSNRVPDVDSIACTQAKLVQYAESGEFKRIVMNVIAKKATTEEIRDLNKTFCEFDRNGDGTVSLSEFRKALSNSSLSDTDIQMIFKKLDVNKQNNIIYTEFIASLLEIRGRLEEAKLADAFEQLDSDDTGFISQANLRQILGKTGVSKEYVRRLIEEADLDNDGKISFEEFKLYLTKRNEEYVHQVLETQ